MQSLPYVGDSVPYRREFRKTHDDAGHIQFVDAQGAVLVKAQGDEWVPVSDLPPDVDAQTLLKDYRVWQDRERPGPHCWNRQKTDGHIQPDELKSVMPRQRWIISRPVSGQNRQESHNADRDDATLQAFAVGDMAVVTGHYVISPEISD